MINYLSKFNYLSIKLITCQNKLIADQKLIDYRGPCSPITATAAPQQGRIKTKVGLMLRPEKRPIFFSAVKTDQEAQYP